MNTQVKNRVAAIRKSRGVAAADLARRINVSRPTIYAIEAGTYIPNTEVALHLARELEVTVEDLFSLPQGSSKPPEAMSAEILSASSAAKGQPVRICQIGSHWVGIPVSATPYFMPEADGVVQRPARSGAQAKLLAFAKEESSQKNLILAGCDPATGLLSRMVEKATGVEIITAAASSKLALKWLCEGKVHVAGSHLEDSASGEFNRPYLRKEFPDEELMVITFARWEEGLVVAPGNPKSIQKIEDLARRGVTFVNRELGSGARALMDKRLKKAGVDASAVNGYERIAFGHLAAAYCVVTQEADVCLATRSAAQAFSLDFIPLHSERYDLVMRKQTADMPAAKALLDVLQRAALRRKLEVLAGYDTTDTGALVA